MAPIVAAVLASLALLSTATALPGSSYGSNCPKAPKFPSVFVSLYDKLFCASNSLLAGTPYALKAGSCQNNPSNETFISANLCLNDAVPKGYECKVILYSDANCGGFGTATAPLAEGQDVCAIKLTASSLEQGTTLGGASVGLVCRQLTDGTTVA